MVRTIDLMGMKEINNVNGEVRDIRCEVAGEAAATSSEPGTPPFQAVPLVEDSEVMGPSDFDRFETELLSFLVSKSMRSFKY